MYTATNCAVFHMHDYMYIALSVWRGETQYAIALSSQLCFCLEFNMRAVSISPEVYWVSYLSSLGAWSKCACTYIDYCLANLAASSACCFWIYHNDMELKHEHPKIYIHTCIAQHIAAPSGWLWTPIRCMCTARIVDCRALQYSNRLQLHRFM